MASDSDAGSCDSLAFFDERPFFFGFTGLVSSSAAMRFFAFGIEASARRAALMATSCFSS
jgi:hypothetical protein